MDSLDVDSTLEGKVGSRTLYIELSRPVVGSAIGVLGGFRLE